MLGWEEGGKGVGGGLGGKKEVQGVQWGTCHVESSVSGYDTVSTQVGARSLWEENMERWCTAVRLLTRG